MPGKYHTKQDIPIYLSDGTDLHHNGAPLTLTTILNHIPVNQFGNLKFDDAIWHGLPHGPVVMLTFTIDDRLGNENFLLDLNLLITFLDCIHTPQHWIDFEGEKWGGLPIHGGYDIEVLYRPGCGRMIHARLHLFAEFP